MSNKSKGKFRLQGLVSWKQRRDNFQNSDNVSGMGDQVDCFEDMESPSLTGSPIEVKFIMKDETNADAFKALKHKKWW
jgi:hypothetical protein